MGENPHDKTDPRVSTAILTEHTRDGVELARRHHLPEPIIDMIRQHHGDTPVMYFYAKAVKMFGEENVDIREKVFYAMAKANCPIYEMQVKRVSLEDVFLELTEGEKKSAGKPESSQWKPVEDRSSEEEKTQEEKNGEPEKASDEKEGDQS